jgi:Na+-driven multidrug efflux pump
MVPDFNNYITWLYGFGLIGGTFLLLQLSKGQRRSRVVLLVNLIAGFLCLLPAALVRLRVVEQSNTHGFFAIVYFAVFVVLLLIFNLRQEKWRRALG